MVLKGVQDPTVLLHVCSKCKATSHSQNECGNPVSSQSVTFKRGVAPTTAGKPTSQANISTKKRLSDFPSHADTPIIVDLLEYELCNHPDKNTIKQAQQSLTNSKCR